METSLVVALIGATVGAISGVAALIRSKGQNRNEEVEKIAKAYDDLQQNIERDYERKERDVTSAREAETSVRELLSACEDDRDRLTRRLARYRTAFGGLPDDA